MRQRTREIIDGLAALFFFLLLFAGLAFYQTYYGK